MAVLELFQSPLFNDASLVNYYRLEGNSNDSKGSNNGTDTAVTYSTADGKFNQGCNFTSLLTSKIELASAPFTGTGNWSIALWIKQNGNPSTNVALGAFGNTVTNAHYIQPAILSSGKVNCDANGVSGPTSTGTVTDNSFHFIVFVNSGGTISIYIDGLLDGSAVVNPNLDSTYHKLGTRFDDLLTSNFTGAMDDVAFFTRALSASEILNYFKGTVGLLLLGV